jgi:nitronate monooxygenase
MSQLETTFTKDVGIDIPMICGAMYPCSNPELIAAASKAGGIGIIQPISMTFVYKHELKEGISLIKKLTDKPVGFNAIVEKSSKIYEDRMRAWVDIAIDEGVRFFITALGNPAWVVKKVHAVNGKVYHDVTSRKWAEKAIKNGIDGLICVNSRAGGHAGEKTPEQLYEELSGLNVPLVCAGGIGNEKNFTDALKLGYDGVQMGTRFIATTECLAHQDYKEAILHADEEDIVLTEKISGVPVSIIKTPYIDKTGTKANWFARKLLRHPKGKHYMRMFYSLKSIWQLKKAALKGMNYKDFFLAGKSVSGIKAVEPVEAIIRRFAKAARQKIAGKK